MKKLMQSFVSLLLALTLLTGAAALPDMQAAQAASSKPTVTIVTWDGRTVKSGKTFATSDNGQKYTASVTIHYGKQVTKLRARLLNPKGKVVDGQDQKWTVKGSGTVEWSCSVPKGAKTGSYKLRIDATQGKKTTAFTFVWKVTKYVYAAKPSAAMQKQFDYLKKQLPQGKFWNHGVKGTKTVILDDGTVTSISTHRCTSWSHKKDNFWKSKSTCNHVANGYQCHGFALLLALYTWGHVPQESSKKTGTAEVNSLKPGDVVRFLKDKHTMFVLKVEKGTVYYADCNWGNTCRIRWNGKISVSSLKKTFSYVYKYDLRNTGYYAF